MPLFSQLGSRQAGTSPPTGGRTRSTGTDVIYLFDRWQILLSFYVAVIIELVDDVVVVNNGCGCRYDSVNIFRVSNGLI